MLRKKILVLVLLGLLGITVWGVKDLFVASPDGILVADKNKSSDLKPYVATDHPLYKCFLAEYGDKKPLLTGVNDINNDGWEDLIVIYQDTSATNKMIAIWEEDGIVSISEPAPAPIENCRLEWRNIDDKDPIELIISGSKGVNVGYAIYRWEKGYFVNLFGTGMEDCC